MCRNESAQLLLFGMWYVVLQKCIDYLKVVPDLYSETCLTPSHDGNQVISIKAEDFTDTENEEEDPLLIQFPVIKPEFEVSCVSMCT